MKHNMYYREQISEELRKDLDELIFDINNKNSENILRTKEITHRLKNMHYHIDRISNYVEDREWEINKIDRHEHFNSLLLIVPTILGALILIYSIISINRPQHNEITSEQVLKIDRLQDQNKHFKEEVRVLQDTLDKLRKKRLK